MLAEVIVKRSARSVTESSAETLIAPSATLVAVLVRSPRSSINAVVSTRSGGGVTYTFPMSVVESGGAVTLDNDESTPGNDEYYGTDGAGARGYHALPVVPAGKTFSKSIVDTSGDVTLVNDETTPDSQQYYGTDATGARGYYNLPSVPPPTGTYLISGGGVVWGGTGFLYHVAATVYVINGTQYTAPATDVTLAASDPTNDRIDVIAVDNTGTVVVITGTPGGPPVSPQIDPATQLQLTFIYVPAASTVPVVTTENIYHENTEYTSSVSGAINAASTNNPHVGTKDIEATAAAAGAFVNLAKPSGTLSLADYTSLSFWIRSKAAWPNQKTLSIFWRNGTTNVGTAIALKTGVFGFDSSNTTTYQLIVIPVAAFNAGTNPVNQLRATIAGGGGNIGWYIDDIILQSGGNGGGTGNGDFSTNTITSVAGEVVVFADTTGKLGKRGTEGTDFLGPARISDTAYDATTWNGDTTHAPSKNAVRDKFESLAAATHAVTLAVDGAGSVLTTGTKNPIKIPYGGTLIGWLLVGTPSGSVTVDILRAANGAGLPVTSIIGGSGTKPALSSAVENSSTSFTSWTSTTLTAKDNLAISLSGITACTYVALTLYFA